MISWKKFFKGKVSWKCPNSAKRKRKNLRQNSSDNKNRFFSIKNQSNHLLFFHQSGGVVSLFSPHEPRELEKITICPLENHFVKFFFANFSAINFSRWPKNTTHVRIILWATTCLPRKDIGSLGDWQQIVGTYKCSGQITKLQKVSAIKPCWLKVSHHFFGKKLRLCHTPMSMQNTYGCSP